MITAHTKGVRRIHGWLLLLAGTWILLLLKTSGQDASVGSAQPQVVLKRPAADWVREFPSDFIAAQPTETERRALGGIWYLLVESQEDARSQTVYHHHARRFLTDEAVGNHADIHFTYDPAHEHLVFHMLKIHRDGQVIDHLPTQTFEIVRTEDESDRQVYDGQVRAIALVEGVRAGDTMEYAASIVGGNPVFDGTYAGSIAVTWDAPVREARRRLLLPLDPSGKRAIRSFNGDHTLLVQEQDDHVEYLWEGRDLPPVKFEDATPDWFTADGWIEVSDFGNWQTVAEWASRQYPITSELPDALKQEVATIRDLEGDEAKTLAALRYVQDKIRYVGMFKGVHSHRPYPLEVISRRGFGDCKDKSLMLCSILRALEIDAAPALVNTSFRHVIAEWPPSPGSFDHLITCVRIDGRLHWIDPTRRAQRGPLQSMYLPDYSKALIVEPTTTELTDIPRQGHAESKTAILEQFTFTDYAGEAQLDVTTVYSGVGAERVRSWFATESRDDIQKNYVDYYDDLYDSIKALGEINTSDDEAKNEFTVTERYAISSLWEERDDEDPDQLFVDFTALAIADALKSPDSPTRKMPLAISNPSDITEVLKIKFPSDLEPETDAFSKRNSAFEFDYTESYSNNTLTSTYHYRSLKDHVPPDEMEAYAEAIEEVEDHTGYWVSVPDGYKLGDYDIDIMSELGLKGKEHLLWGIIIGVVVLILLLVAFITAAILYANRTSKPKTTPLPLLPPHQHLPVPIPEVSRPTPPPLPPKHSEQ